MSESTSTSPQRSLAERVQEHAQRRSGAIDKGVAAMARLVKAVRHNPGCGQTQRVARFLLGLYNGANHPFDLTDLRGLDTNLLDDCLDALALDAMCIQECHTWFKDGEFIWQSMQAGYAKSAKLRKSSRECLKSLTRGGE